MALEVELGRHALSPEADRLIAEVRNLLTDPERRSFDQMLDRRVVKSPGWRDWVLNTTSYLADLDPQTVDELMTELTAQRVELKGRGVERGWEI